MKSFILSLCLIFIGISETLAGLPNGIMLPLEPGERIALPVSDDQMIVASSPSSVAIILVKHAEGKKSSYTFRHFDRETKAETSGTGNLLESYIKHPREGGGFEVEDAGSELKIEAGGITLHWSYGSALKCYIYFEIDGPEVTLLHARYYEHINFE